MAAPKGSGCIILAIGVLQLDDGIHVTTRTPWEITQNWNPVGYYVWHVTKAVCVVSQEEGTKTKKDGKDKGN